MEQQKPQVDRTLETFLCKEQNNVVSNQLEDRTFPISILSQDPAAFQTSISPTAPFYPGELLSFALQWGQAVLNL